MTDTQFKSGVEYALNVLESDNDTHLDLDKEIIRSRFNLNKKRVLDFGCGMGGMTLWYAKNWDCFACGIDIDKHHLEIAHHLQKKLNVNNVKFELCDILNENVSEEYDYIFLNDVIEHVPIHMLGHLLQKLKDLLSEEGYIFISYPPWRSPYASHLNQAIHIPWCQFLPSFFLEKLIDRYNQVIVGEKEGTLKDVYYGLNKLDPAKLKKLTSGLGLTTVYRYSHTFLNRLNLFRKINLDFSPFNYLVTKEFLILQK